jgi:hypothetical protein
MDPNETLRVLREAVEQWNTLPANTDPAWRREVGDAIAEHAEALDAWLTRGGFLPEAWQRDPDRDRRCGCGGMGVHGVDHTE